jgi:hypothetical protein
VTCLDRKSRLSSNANRLENTHESKSSAGISIASAAINNSICSFEFNQDIVLVILVGSLPITSQIQRYFIESITYQTKRGRISGNLEEEKNH